MDAGQRREAVRLIKGRCSYYDGGNCLYLDGGEEVTCPQSISYSVCCKFFRHVLLKDEAGRGLEAAVFRREALKRCLRCGVAFSSASSGDIFFSRTGTAAAEGRLRPEAEGGSRKVGGKKARQIKASGPRNPMPPYVDTPRPEKRLQLFYKEVL